MGAFSAKKFGHQRAPSKVTSQAADTPFARLTTGSSWLGGGEVGRRGIVLVWSLCGGSGIHLRWMLETLFRG